MNFGLFEISEGAIAKWVKMVIRYPLSGHVPAVVLEIPEENQLVNSKTPANLQVCINLNKKYYPVRVDTFPALMLSVPDGTRRGGNKRGSAAVDLQLLRNDATQVASGSFSVIAGGVNNIATGIYSSVLAGRDNSATGSYSCVAGGAVNTATGSYSCASGGVNNIASGTYSRAGGYCGTAISVVGRDAYGASGFAVAGARQTSNLITIATTTSATPKTLTAGAAAAGLTTIMAMSGAAADSITAIYLVKYMAIGRQHATGDVKCWEGSFAVERAGNAATTAILGTPSYNVVFEEAGSTTWTIEIQANTTYGGPVCVVTGEAAHTIQWECMFTSLELIGS